MDRSSTHRRQRGKNWFAFGALVLFVAGLYYLTILKVSGV